MWLECQGGTTFVEIRSYFECGKYCKIEIISKVRISLVTYVL